MIFITVGTQLPFDRLMEYFAEWYERSEYKGKVIAQVGENSKFQNSKFEIVESLTSDQYYRWFTQADGIVSHAGMGSILSCLEYGKRGVFLPRKYALAEHRNDHQLDTANAFKEEYATLTFCSDKLAFFDAMDSLMENVGTEVLLAEPQVQSELGQNIAKYLGLKGKLS